jgi:hypothetical protein
MASTTEWNLLTNHGRTLLCVVRDPDARLRDIAATLGITERRVFGIVNDLAEAGYVTKERVGRRNRYVVQRHLPIPGAFEQGRAIGEVLELLVGSNGKNEESEG